MLLSPQEYQKLLNYKEILCSIAKERGFEEFAEYIDKYNPYKEKEPTGEIDPILSEALGQTVYKMQPIPVLEKMVESPTAMKMDSGLRPANYEGAAPYVSEVAKRASVGITPVYKITVMPEQHCDGCA